MPVNAVCCLGRVLEKAVKARGTRWSLNSDLMSIFTKGYERMAQLKALKYKFSTQSRRSCIGIT
jgi:hypothetical protein